MYDLRAESWSIATITLVQTIAKPLAVHAVLVFETPVFKLVKPAGMFLIHFLDHQVPSLEETFTVLCNIVDVPVPLIAPGVLQDTPIDPLVLLYHLWQR